MDKKKPYETARKLNTTTV